MPKTIRDSIDALLARALELAPDRRYSTTRAFCRAIGDVDQLLKQASGLKPGQSGMGKVSAFLRRWFGSDPLHVVVARFQQGHSFPLIKGGKA